MSAIQDSPARSGRPHFAAHPLRGAIRSIVFGLAIAGGSLHVVAATAPVAAHAAAKTYNLPAGPLGRTLSGIAAESGMPLSFDPALTDGLNSTALSGNFTARDAIERALEGSGLELVERGDGSFTLRRLSAEAAGATTLGTVKVSDSVQDDPTTEHSHSYTSRAVTIGGGTHALRETPQSISVVTRQRMDDQNMTSIEEAMRYTTGMKVTNYGVGGSAAVEARGYTVDHYAMDGVSSSARVYEGNFNLAMYDRIEVWRGPAGLLQGSGEPSGTINLVRKRANKDFALNAKVSAGSWDNYLGEVDVTGALNDSGTLRGRTVVSYQDRHYFTDEAWSRAPMIYATLEYDFDPSTTLSVGATTQANHSRPFFGLSAYEDGGYPDISRSTFLGADWNRQYQRSTREFAELEHRFDNGGTGKLTASYLDRNENAEYEWGNSMIDENGTVEMVPYFSRSHVKEVNLDGQLVWPLEWRGLPQEFLAGANYQRFTTDSGYNGSTWGENGFDINVFHPDTHVPKPEIVVDPLDTNIQKQRAVYGQARLKPWEPVTVLVGGRLAWFENEQHFADQTVADTTQRTSGKLIPYFGVIGDVSKDFSPYASYSEIFAPQNAQRADNTFLPPRKGEQYEVGMKGSHFDDRVNTSLALYRIEDTNRAMSDPTMVGSIPAGKVRSRGVEAEVSGTVVEGWNITAGYGYNELKVLKDSPESEGKSFNTMFPRNSFSLWSDYKVTQELGVGGGVRYSSSIYNESDGVRWGEGGYSVWSAQVNYRFNATLKGALTMNNLFDKHYFDRPDSGWRQTYYGEPRNVTVTLNYTL